MGPWAPRWPGALMEGDRSHPSLLIVPVASSPFQRPGRAGWPPLPDTQVGPTGIVAPGREHPAGVGADVPRPSLRDVQGAISVQADPRVVVRGQRGSILLPDIPENQKCQLRGEKGQWAEGTVGRGDGLSPKLVLSVPGGQGRHQAPAGLCKAGCLGVQQMAHQVTMAPLWPGFKVGAQHLLLAKSQHQNQALQKVCFKRGEKTWVGKGSFQHRQHLRGS